MKSYKIIENGDTFYSNFKGRVIVQFEDAFIYNGKPTDLKVVRTLLAATPTQPQVFWDNATPERMVQKGFAQEIDLLQEKWLHYHLYKPLKKAVSELTGVNIP